MGGVQSGPHSLGEDHAGRDALWAQERLRYKLSRVPREGRSHEQQPGGSSTSSRDQQRKLLKRTKSLAVISEENKNPRESNYYRLGEPSLTDAFRRQQLIPRAKLINRHSLKDRLSKSQHHLHESFDAPNPKVHRTRLTTSDTYGVSDPKVAFSNFAQQNCRQSRNPDQLNILEWPEVPKRYQSVQALDNVSGLVDVVEENWPSEGNRSLDCIYTQVRKKRKEHRSLDSVLFEDDKELEYFDVLDLLPLSNVRLEFEDRSAERSSGDNSVWKSSETFDTGSRKYRRRRSSLNDTDNYDVWTRGGSSSSNEDTTVKIVEAINKKKIKDCESKESSREKDHPVKRVLVLDSEEDKFRAEVVVVEPVEVRKTVEESEDFKSIWISDSEETEDMSRRPQVLKVIDNDVTKRNRNSMIELDDVAEARRNVGARVQDEKPPPEEENMTEEPQASPGSVDQPKNEGSEEVQVEAVRSFFETKCKENERKSGHVEGKFERIIKETSNMFGKACSAVKGSLGFEARSESSDLGLGSESGSDTRRQSVDEDHHEAESTEACSGKEPSKDAEDTHATLSRSFSCADSMQNDCGPEFDHIRYKIMKSDLFSKNMFGSMKNEQNFDGLMQYLQEYSFHDLLVDNNVVIIEPVRAEPVERKASPIRGRSKSSSCRIAGTIQKTGATRQEQSSEGKGSESPKSPRQTSLRRHFFYHPIRVNRELIDDELPDPDTVRNVRKMFETTLKLKTPDSSFPRNSPARKTVSMKDLSQIDRLEPPAEKNETESRSSRAAKTLTRRFENFEKSCEATKEEMENPRSESKTRIIAQAFEARSGQTSPSETGSSKRKVSRYHHNWDAGSVSSGVSSDYPDTDPGSGAQCTSSEDEDEGRDDDLIDSGPSHSVSQDVLKKIRECGTTVTYYGGRVVNTSNSPLISPPKNGKLTRHILRNDRKAEDDSKDYVKFRLVKSNSCDSRLELAGRLVNEADRLGKKFGEAKDMGRRSDLREFPIMENLNVDVAASEEVFEPKIKKEPPIVIGLEPKKEEVKEPEVFRADFKLGKLEDTKCYANKFSSSAFNQWQVNDKIEERKCKFGEIDFEEFEVLDDSLNSNAKQN